MLLSYFFGVLMVSVCFAMFRAAASPSISWRAALPTLKVLAFRLFCEIAMSSASRSSWSLIPRLFLSAMVVLLSALLRVIILGILICICKRFYLGAIAPAEPLPWKASLGRGTLAVRCGAAPH